ncbi:HET-domain-containing protein [Annulohypoxylon truncatum]|uniref:HET-domain-containing protein n=1 Tax=Annulohypoxylon truncatum TaxID=327061 RepID=UPI0020071E60|nr:HET-domain-containing protein [Annulohypoxylon truncatum]KAI1204529.1 HET-domain-containing protein [Annulohypoxylon truncatum]
MIETPIYNCLCVYEQHPFGHHYDPPSLRRSAKQGCAICSDIPFYFNREDQKSGGQILGFCTIFKISCCGADRFDITIESSYGSKLIELVPLKNHSLPYRSLNFDLRDSTDSSQTWSMIFDWMKKCSNHERCKSEVRSKRYKPTRLLQTNFRRLYGRESHTFRLVRGNKCPSNLPYVTLSYRWGNKPLDDTLRLLKKTSDWLQTSNPIDCLPKTFRDAMYIASRFNIRYIWIDRLCIYQDSPEDWRTEARAVRDVYRNAEFCISALSSEDDEGGCLFIRDPTLVAPTIINLNLNRTETAFRADVEDAAWRGSFLNEPLIKRGWVHQERLMSPRTIYFGKKQVYWECAELHACETHPAGFEEFIPVTDSSNPNKDLQRGEDRFRLWKQLIAAPQSQRTERDWRIQVFASWSAAISAYSGTELTNPSDKLVAVSGLAQDIKTNLRSDKLIQLRYLAGLWEDVLIETLLWYVKVGARASRPTIYRAPSWSWASLDGQIIMPDKFLTEITKLSRLVFSRVGFLGEDDTGEVGSGWLTLLGPTCLIETEGSSDNRRTVKSFRTPGDQQLVGCYDSHDGWFGKSTVIFDIMEELMEEFFCLWMVTQPAASRGWEASGLALRACVESSTYERIGTVSCYYADKAGLDGFIEAFPSRMVKVI